MYFCRNRNWGLKEMSTLPCLLQHYSQSPWYRNHHHFCHIGIEKDVYLYISHFYLGLSTVTKSTSNLNSWGTFFFKNRGSFHLGKDRNYKRNFKRLCSYAQTAFSPETMKMLLFPHQMFACRWETSSPSNPSLSVTQFARFLCSFRLSKLGDQNECPINSIRGRPSVN